MEYDSNIKHRSDFNSIKVRLKLSWVQPGISWVQSFQFHKGTIKTTRRETGVS